MCLSYLVKLLSDDSADFHVLNSANVLPRFRVTIPLIFNLLEAL